MNLISDFEAHKRDEDFDREDAKSAHATHVQRVAFADAMMQPRCERCDGEGFVSIEGEGDIIEASCPECSPENDNE